MTPQGIDYFNRGHWLSSLQERISLKARERMYRLWKVQGKKRVLDVGATPDLERSDSNCILKWLVEDGHEVSALSPEALVNMPEYFRRIEILPPMTSSGWNVPDQSYDWVFSSAVLEHVGSEKEEFLREAARTGKGIFLTTPNRWHWLEFHTKIPFLHWLPKSVHRKILRLLGKDFWAEEKNLDLISEKELRRLADKVLGRDFRYSVEIIWALGMPSNLVLIAERITALR